MKTAGAARKPLIDKRLRNVLFSFGVCSALIVAYYMAVEREAVPADTQLVWRGSDRRVEVTGDGAVVIVHEGKTWRYRITGFALRRMLRALHRQGFMELDAAHYNRGACMLSWQQGGRKTALLYDCDHAPPAIVSGLQALEKGVKSRDVLREDK